MGGAFLRHVATRQTRCRSRSLEEVSQRSARCERPPLAESVVDAEHPAAVGERVHGCGQQPRCSFGWSTTSTRPARVRACPLRPTACQRASPTVRQDVGLQAWPVVDPRMALTVPEASVALDEGREGPLPCIPPATNPLHAPAPGPRPHRVLGRRRCNGSFEAYVQLHLRIANSNKRGTYKPAPCKTTAARGTAVASLQFSRSGLPSSCPGSTAAVA